MNGRQVYMKGTAVKNACSIGLLCCYCCMVACAPVRNRDDLKAEISRLLLERDSLLKAASVEQQLQRSAYIADTNAIRRKRQAWEMKFPPKDLPWIVD